METILEYLKNNEVAIARGTAIFMALMAIITYFWNRKKYSDTRKDKKTDLKHELNLAQVEIKELKSQKDILRDARDELKEKVSELTTKIAEGAGNVLENDQDKELIQLEKIVYAKYLYIVPDAHPPVYQRRVDRLDRDIPVRTESVHYKLNRYNKINNNVTVMDSSSKGVVDMAIIYPWSKLKGHKTQLDKPHELTQKLSGSDTYITATTYINGFIEGEEDYAIMGEHFTKSARIIADFSTIQNLEKLFLKEPDAYRYFDPQKKKENPINNCIQRIRHGVYALHVNDLESGEIIEFDFHINWKYMDE